MWTTPCGPSRFPIDLMSCALVGAATRERCYKIVAKKRRPIHNSTNSSLETFPGGTVRGFSRLLCKPPSLIQTISFIFSQHCIVSPNCVPRKFFLWINLPQTPPLGPPPQVFALQTKYKTCFDDPRTPHTDLYRTYMVTKVMKWYEMCSSNQSNLLPILQ